MASNNMANSRKVLMSNLPQNITSNEIIQELFKSQNFKYNDIDFHGSSAIVTLSNANEAKRAAKLINGQLFRGIRISVIEAPPPPKPAPSSGAVTPFLLIGNLSFDFTEKQFKDLMRPHGEIKNAFLVRGKISKKSKGYGFVEYNETASATRAKEHFKKTDAKYIDGRAIRIESVSANVATGEAKHSRSLFVDKLPKSFEDDEEIRNLFSTAGTVTFCKVARTKEGQPRGYAMVDYKTVVEAEKGQEKLDGAQVGDSNIRVSFCPPGKTAEEKFSKFDTPNHRQPGGGRGQLHSARAGMVGPRGPRIQSLIPRNPGPFLNLGGVGGRPGFSPPAPLRTPFGFGGLPGLPRMQMMRPRPPILGPGPQLRVPIGQSLLRTPGFRNGHPGVKPGQGVRKNRPNARPGLVTLKPRPEKKPSSKTIESASKEKEATDNKKKDSVVEKNLTKETSKAAESQKPKADKADNAQPKQDEKPKTSVPESGTAEQKGTAVAAKTNQPSEDGEKDLQPVVFMDTEQLKQFRQFQELMKKQKEAEKSGDSKPVSLEDLVKIANEETQKTVPQLSKSEPFKSSVESKQSDDPPKRQKQGGSKQTSEMSGPSKPETTKPSPAVSKSPSSFSKPPPSSTNVSTATAKPSFMSTKPTPALNKSAPVTPKPSPAPIKLSSSFGRPQFVSDKSGFVSKSSSVTTKSSARPTQSTQQAVQRQERSTKPPHNSYQRPSQPQQRFQAENQKSIKAAGSYERGKNHYDRNSLQDSKSTSSVSRNESPSSSSPMQLPTPPKPSTAANLLQKLFGGKFAGTQDTYGSEQQTSKSKADSFSPHESYQLGRKSNTSLSEMSRDAPSSRQHSKYSYDKQYQNTDGRDYELKRSPVNVRESNLRSYTLPERLPHARGNDEPARYDRQPERELITYPRPRSDLHLRQDAPPARDMKAPYDTFQSRSPVESRDSHREMRSTRDAVPPRNVASLRDILPPRDNSPNSRDTLLPRDRSSRDHLQRDLPPRDVSSRNLPPHDISPRNLPRRDASPRNLPPRDASPRNLPPRDASPRNLPPRDFPRDVSSRDLFPPRGMPPRDDRSARDPYMRELDNQREPFPYDNSPSHYQSSPLSSREALDRARFERSMGTGAHDSRGDYPAYRGEPEPRYGRDLPSRESALGTIRGSPARYPMEGPQSKRPRY